MTLPGIPEPLRGLSLWQPWASAIAAGLKRIETRSWSTPYRGLVALHAAKTQDEGGYHLAAALHAAGRLPPPLELPFGAVVAIARLVDVVPTTACRDLGELERELGNYEPGRFAWKLDHVAALTPPVAMRGMQGLWKIADDEARRLFDLAGVGSR